MINPVTPGEMVGVNNFPDEVIKAFNKLITAKYRNGTATVTAAEVIEELKDFADKDTIYKEKYLDVEDLFGKHGWKVKYSSPDRGDRDYPAYFTFTKA
jgi:hypothetical protein